MPSFLLVSRRSPPASWLLVVFLFCPWCCSESEDSVINLRIQHSNCLWYLFDFVIPCTLSPSQVSLRYNLSTTVCTCTPCQRASYTSKTDSFLWGHGPDTLACKARPSFDGCGTSLSVSLSLSLSLSVLWSRIAFEESTAVADSKNDRQQHALKAFGTAVALNGHYVSSL